MTAADLPTCREALRLSEAHLATTIKAFVRMEQRAMDAEAEVTQLKTEWTDERIAHLRAIVRAEKAEERLATLLAHRDAEDAVRERNRTLGAYGREAPATPPADPDNPTRYAYVVSLEGKDHYVVRHNDDSPVSDGVLPFTTLVSTNRPEAPNLLTFDSVAAAHAAIRTLFVRHPWAVKWRVVTIR